ncbi:MAG: hypothetical protein MJZ06_03400 [Bacteroidaceae bacterium]|nr:hypothetical protein [Bacteroidaceae bacterium]
MPYRRLPNTDQARIRSLSTVIDAIRNNDLYVPVLSPELFNRADRQLRQFKAASDLYCQSNSKLNGFSKSPAYQNKLHNARMYVSHFLIVLNLCVKRGEIKEADRLLYGLPEHSAELPDLLTDSQVINCCKAAIEGERARTQKGGMPIFNPTIAKVNVHYDLFHSMYEQQQSLRHETDLKLAAVAVLRPETDAIILEAWNAIEEYFKDLQGEKKLEACRKYGIIYYYRPGEKKKTAE